MVVVSGGWKQRGGGSDCSGYWGELGRGEGGRVGVVTVVGGKEWGVE